MRDEQRSLRGRASQRPAEIAAGFLAAISMTASAIALVYRPVRLAPFAILVALIAAGLAKDRNSKLAGAAVAFATLCLARRDDDRRGPQQADLLKTAPRRGFEC